MLLLHWYPVEAGGTKHPFHSGSQDLLWEPGGYSPYRQGECLDMNQYSLSFIAEDAEDRRACLVTWGARDTVAEGSIAGRALGSECGVASLGLPISLSWWPSLHSLSLLRLTLFPSQPCRPRKSCERSYLFLLCRAVSEGSFRTWDEGQEALGVAGSPWLSFSVSMRGSAGGGSWARYYQGHCLV